MKAQMSVSRDQMTADSNPIQAAASCSIATLDKLLSHLQKNIKHRENK